MKQIFFYLSVLVSPLFLSSCIGGRGASDSLIVARSAIDTKEQDRRDREESEETLRGECGEYRDCEGICEDVYDEDGDRENEGKVEKCLEEQYKTVISFERILEIIEEPYYADLRLIKAKDFKAFLEISVAPWVEKTKRLSNRESEDLLKWIASESKVASAIKDAYSSGYEDFDLYEGLESLFEEIAPSNSSLIGAERLCYEICHAINSELLSQNKNFWTIADDTNNAAAKTLACGLIKRKCPGRLAFDVGNHCPSSFEADCS